MWQLFSGLVVCVFVTVQLAQGNQTSTFGSKISSYSQYNNPAQRLGPSWQGSLPSLVSTPKRLIDVQQPSSRDALSGRPSWPYSIQQVETKADVSFLYMSKKSPVKDCGIPVLGRVRRIVGGTQAERCTFPWMVYISRDPGKDDLCGGTLVSDRHIITAAHCYDNLGTNWPVLYIGEYNRQGGSPKTRFVSTSYKLSVHPRYSRLTFSYDIAILTLNIPIALESYECLRPICLPDEQHVLRLGDSCTVAGWGSTSRTRNTPAVSSPFLMKTKIRVLNESSCKAKFGNLFNGHSQICAGDLTGNNDSCVGDSGGPMMCSMTGPSLARSSQTDIQYLMGVISSGATPCAQAGTPALYTDIQKVRSWIRSVVKF
ncbi:unnamed protein product [Candidula unifasciata]|uniref:Peptidase S1 domain-containing protein n=1 Tax=Candidula unifasciata TaxID=100452 RepID=A0A8S3ZEH0_9EUPU|nr:unnamed protein product [Candidula unifasciata]